METAAGLNGHDIQEMASLNVDDLDVEELEQRLEQAAVADCDCWGNDCGSYCNTPPPPPPKDT